MSYKVKKEYLCQKLYLPDCLNGLNLSSMATLKRRRRWQFFKQLTVVNMSVPRSFPGP